MNTSPEGNASGLFIRENHWYSIRQVEYFGMFIEIQGVFEPSLNGESAVRIDLRALARRRLVTDPRKAW